MKRLLLFAAVLSAMQLSSIAFAAEGAGVTPETTALYRSAKDQVEKLSATPAVKYSAETVGQARKSLAAAQKGLEAGDDKTTRDFSDKAILQAKLALALSDERIAAEKSASAAKELAALEQRLGNILAGKGELQ